MKGGLKITMVLQVSASLNKFNREMWGREVVSSDINY